MSIVRVFQKFINLNKLVEALVLLIADPVVMVLLYIIIYII